MRRRVAVGGLIILALLTFNATHAAEGLVWKFEPGLTNRYRSVQATQFTIDTGAGGKVTSDSEMRIDISWTVQKVNGDGSAVLQQRIERMRMAAQTGETSETVFDSAAKEEPQGQAAMLGPLVKAITGHPFKVTMTPRGEIKQVEVPEAIAEALKNQPGAAQMGDLATPEGFKKLVQQATFVLPEKLEPGVQWTTKTETNLPGAGTQTATTTYKYAGPVDKDGKQLERFTATVEMKFAGGQVPIEITDQESEGEILFNREAGRLETSNLDLTTHLKITTGGQVIEQDMEHSVEMEWKNDWEEEMQNDE